MANLDLLDLGRSYHRFVRLLAMRLRLGHGERSMVEDDEGGGLRSIISIIVISF